MPLLVPLVLALVLAAGASLMWVWARYIAHRRHGTPLALLVVGLAAGGVWLLVAAQGADASVPEAAGWVALGASALALPAAWLALARPGAPSRR